MSTSDIRRLLADMQQLLERSEARRTADTAPPPTGETGASLELDAADSLAETATDPSADYGGGHFGPEHRLSPQQARVAEHLLRTKPPFRGRHKQQREAARIRGIASSVRLGRVGNSGWGRSMLATKGGLAMANHAPHILEENRERILARRRALQAFPRRQAPPKTPYDAWQRSLATPTAQRDPQPDFLTW